jgi:3-hydroxyacyl-CoA dehydrogenase
MSAESAGRLALLISGSSDQQVFAGCDFVIEAIFEELSLKQDLFKKLEECWSRVRSSN